MEPESAIYEAYGSASGLPPQVPVQSDGAHPEFVSLKELRGNLKDAMKRSGVMHSVKAQIRNEFIKVMTDGTNELSPSASGRRGGKLLMSDAERAARSCVFHFMQARSMSYSLSVYAAECGLDQREMMTEAELADKLHLSSHLRADKGKSIIDYLLQDVETRMRKTTTDQGTQSDYSGASVREMLDSRMREINSTYQYKREQEKLFPTRTLEEKMLHFQRECEKRFQDDLEAQVKTIREVEISRVRLEEASRARMEFEALRADMEATFERKLAAQAERELETQRQTTERERLAQQNHYEVRQRLQRELEDLRSREHAIARKLELDNQGLRLFETRLKELQILLDSREREVSRKEKEFESINRDVALRAKELARQMINDELEALMRERAGLKVERSRFDEDKANWDQVQREATEWRTKCVNAELLLAQKDEELSIARASLARLEARQKAEMSELTGLIKEVTGKAGIESMERGSEDPFSLSAKYSRTQNLIDLVERNAVLETQVKVMDKTEREVREAWEREKTARSKAEAELALKSDELSKLLQFSKDFTLRVEADRKRMIAEKEHLKKLVIMEKTKADSAVMEKTQIEKIIKEQRTALLQINGTHRMGESGLAKEKTARERFIEDEDKALLAELLWIKQRQFEINDNSDAKRSRSKRDDAEYDESVAVSSKGRREEKEPNLSMRNAISNEAPKIDRGGDDRRVAADRLNRDSDDANRRAVQEVAEREEFDRLRREREESDRRTAQESADRLRQEREEADRIRREREETERFNDRKREDANRHAAQESADRDAADQLRREREEAERRAAKDATDREKSDELRRESEEADRRAVQEAADREAADRLRRESEEADSLSREREEADRQAVQEAADREAADRLRRESEEADRLRQEREEADRLRRESDEADRLRLEREEAGRLSREREEADRRAVQEAADREAADRLRQEREEADRRAAQEAADREAAESDDALKRDADAIQAARARVLARRKQKQERDSVESLASVTSAHSASGEAKSESKQDENMSVISDIEVREFEDTQSDGDGDSWF